MKTTRDFVVDPADSNAKRLAKYVLWAHKMYPGRPMPLPLVAQAVLMLTRKPSADGQDVKKIKNALPGAQEIVGTQTGMGIRNIAGVGLRATMDDAEHAKTLYERDARGVVNAAKRLDKRRGWIKTSNISDPALRARVNSIASACRLLTSADIIGKLSLTAPKKDDASSNGKK
jgi:hypothetical protein